MRCKILIGAAIVITLGMFPGCNKKNKFSEPKKSSAIPEMTKKSAADTSDIFKEFYSDDTAQGKGAAKSGGKNHTFSPSSAPATSAAEPVSGDFVENGRYVVQVSCVLSKAFAEKLVRILKEKNFPAYVAEVQNPTPALSGTYHRVRIGCFAGYASAKAFGNNTLVPAGYEFWVDKKANDNTGMEGYGLGGGVPVSNAPALNGSSPTSSWTSSSPAFEAPSPSPFGQSDFSAPSNVSAPPPAPSNNVSNTNTDIATKNAVTTQPSAPSAAVAAPSAPAATAASTPKPTPTASPAAASSPSTPSSSPASSAPGKEGSEWGSDSLSSSGW